MHLLESLERAEKLYNASRYFEDDIFTKTALSSDAKSLLNMKIKYHPSCLRRYEMKYVDARKSINSEAEASGNKNKSIELNYIIVDSIKTIEARVIAGEIFSLKDVAELIIDKNGSEFSIKYNKIKSCLIDYFGNRICFVYPNKKNIPQIFHVYNMTKAVEEYYYKNSTLECVDILNKSLNDVDFKLDDKFCDENDLKTAWETASLPEPFAQFISELFNCDKKDLLGTETEFLLNDERSTKSRVKNLRLKSSFQIIYFIKNNGLKKTPLHILIGLFVYTNTKSKITVTILN